MRRRAAKRGHWGLVLVCLAVAFSPLDLRTGARGLLLDGHARLHGLLSSLDENAGRAVVAQADPSSAGSRRLALLQAEVLHLRKALEDAKTARKAVRLDANVRLIPADVLPLAGPSDLRHRIALARGSLDGVKRGQPVLADGVLVGRVAQVTQTTCEVRLVTDPKFTIRATIPRDGLSVEGLLVGRGSGTLAFQPALLNETAAVPLPKPGEAVLCSRASVLCGVPALLGVVTEIGKRPGASLPEARIQPACDLSSLRQVVILRGSTAS